MSVVVAYDPTWPVRFADEARAIQAALGSMLSGPVEHIGSTAIPGIAAKPIIDMMAPVAELAAAERAIGPLGELGYALHPHRRDAVRFRKPGEAPATYHLHLTEVGSDLWRERLLFRDAVRSSPELRERYAQLKARLLAESGGQVYDAAGKREFVREVLAAAGHELRDGLHTDR